MFVGDRTMASTSLAGWAAVGQNGSGSKHETVTKCPRLTNIWGTHAVYPKRTLQRVRREAELAEHAAPSMIGKQSDVSFDLLSPTVAPPLA